METACDIFHHFKCTCAIELIEPISLSIYHRHSIFIGMRIDVGQGRPGPCSHCLFAVSEVQHLASDRQEANAPQQNENLRFVF